MHNKTILIIEDEKDISRIYKIILEAAGTKVLLANNGKEGLSIAKENKPDLILLDLMMPVLGGVETIKKLRQNHSTKDLPVIVLTNLGRTEVPEEIIDKQVKDVLVKVELTPDSLVEKVAKALQS